MNLYGEIVKHKKFGVGTVVESKDDYIKILFHDTQEQKKFLYPDAVGEFLELQNNSVSDNKEQVMKEMKTGNKGEHEQRRIKDLKGIINREKSIKKLIGLRLDKKK